MHKILPLLTNFIVQVLRFLFLVFLAVFGKFGGMLNVATGKVCLDDPPPDTLHPSARNLSLILC